MASVPLSTLELFDMARRAATFAYNPYSQFAVGCAMRSRLNKIYVGCNIENASFSATICAERVAVSQAVLNGDRDWEQLVVVSPQAVSMCGVCRQFVHEFAPDIEVWTGYIDPDGAVSGPFRLSDLLPSGMRLRLSSE